MTVKIYTIPSCKWCQLLKDYLDCNNVYYKNIDVSKDRFGAIDMIKRSGQSAVPVVEIDETIIIGFNKEQIDKLLSEKIICKS